MAEARQIERIQHLRGLAAFLVLISHTWLELRTKLGVTTQGPIIDGQFGVDIFFIISGFIMYYTSRGEFGASGASQRFFIRRLIRIFPLYCLFTLLFVIGNNAVHAKDITGQIGIGEIAKSLLFIPYNFNGIDFRPALGVGWTLDYEMFFYALFAPILLLSPRRALPALSIIFVALIAIEAYVGGTTPIAAWCQPIILEFLAGVFLAHIFCSLPERVLMPKLPAMPIILGAIVVQSFAANFYKPDSVLTFDRLPYWLFALAVVSTAVLGPRAKNTRMTRGLLLLGNASYSLYLSHPLIISAMSKLSGRRVHDLPTGVAFFVITIALAIAFAIITHVYLEVPATSWLKKWFQGTRPSAVKNGIATGENLTS